MIRLVALDLDGTTFGGDTRVSPAVRAAIAATQAKGVAVPLATGRMFTSTRPIAADLGIRVPLICYQGALVRDPVSAATLFYRPLAADVALEVIALLQAQGLHAQFYLDDVLYVDEWNPGTTIYVGLNKDIRVETIGDPVAFLRAQGSDPTKISVVLADEAATDALVAHLKGRFGDRLYATKSHPIFAETINPTCDKGVALAALAAHLGVAQAEVLAVGDGDNDIPMLRWAGVGVAMGQAAADVQAAADYVTASLTEDGLAAALDRFVLSQSQPNSNTETRR